MALELYQLFISTRCSKYLCYYDKLNLFIYLKNISLITRFCCLAGSTTLQLTPVQSLTDVVTSEVSNLVHLKGYFKGSSNSLDHALNKVIHRETTMCALGGLVNHLARLMVSLLLCPFRESEY